MCRKFKDLFEQSIFFLIAKRFCCDTIKLILSDSRLLLVFWEFCMWSLGFLICYFYTCYLFYNVFLSRRRCWGRGNNILVPSISWIPSWLDWFKELWRASLKISTTIQLNRFNLLWPIFLDCGFFFIICGGF